MKQRKNIISFIAFTLFFTNAAIAAQSSGDTAIPNPPADKIIRIARIESTGEAKDRYIASKVDQVLNKNVFRNGRRYDFGLSSNVPGVTKVNYNGQADALEYTWSWSQGLNYNTVTASYVMEVQERDDHYEVTLKCPTKLTSSVRSLALFGIPQWDLSNIASDVSYACSAAEL